MTYHFTPAEDGRTGRLTIDVPIPTGADLIRTFTERSRQTHADRIATCPGCQQPGLQAVGLPELAFVFDTCACGDPEYTHLVEQLWHRNCLMDISR